MSVQRVQHFQGTTWGSVTERSLEFRIAQTNDSGSSFEDRISASDPRCIAGHPYSATGGCIEKVALIVSDPPEDISFAIRDLSISILTCSVGWNEFNIYKTD
jgi:hypothetical protein